MGFFKKIFKPVSKVLDKIIPNEIKPALPYLAAFAPVFGPTAGMFGSTMGKRMLLSGGANILGQLSQEGNEGDINLLSAGLGALTGAMTTPATGPVIGSAGETITAARPGAAELFRTKATDIGTDTLRGKGLEFLAKGSDIFAKGAADPFSTAGLKAATLPATTATGDVMQAEARRLEKQSIIDAALEEATGLADSAASALAIRNAMEAYGFFSEDEILDTIASAGYANGGRVGFYNGGDVEKELDTVLVMIEGPDGVEVKEVLKSEALRENLKIVSDTGEFNQYRFDNVENKKAGGRVGFNNGGGLMDTVVGMFKKEDKGADFGGITEAVEKIEKEPKTFLVDKLKVTMKPGQSEMRAIIEAMYNDTDNVMSDDRKKEFYELYAPQMYRNGEMKKSEFEFIQTEILGKEMREGGIMATEIPLKDSVKNINKKGQPDTTMVKMKEGGLMNLGGKEMDLRGGGFVPIGKKERADDVPARLSKNEFVMTADAVRAAGGGSVNEGAKRMYDVMNKLEARA